jgi:dUTP pyrophosphatase
MKKFIPKTKQVNFQKIVKIQKLLPTATIPTRGTKGSIGYDVTSITEITIPPGMIQKIPTGLSAKLPPGMYICVAPRSSMALHHISVEGGMIDPDYRGEIKVLLKNNSTKPYTVQLHQKCAQLIFENASTPFLEVVPSLPRTSRSGGFGSTNTISPKSILQRANKDEDNKENRSSPYSLTLPPSVVKPPASASVNLATPKIVTMTKEDLTRSVKFRRVDELIKHMKSTSTSNVKIHKDTSPCINPRDTASMKASRRNTTPLPIPDNVGDVWHLDIGFGPCASIGGFKYTLLAVD